MQVLLGLLEVTAALLAVVLVISFVLTYWYGLETARKNRVFKETCTGFGEYQDAYDRHRRFRWVFLGTQVVAICAIEGMRLVADGSYEFTWFKGLHYALDGVYFILLVMTTIPCNGFRSKSHGKYAYWLAVSGIGVLTTGLYLYIDFVLKH
ncbi:hypothetical protein HYT05_01765 [Candidatus Kaiserbacteria bacterium]|nr:hypothetical protein [Candidatus Kaiserbacteria bacterium]